MFLTKAPPFTTTKEGASDPPCGARKTVRAFALLRFFDRCGNCKPPVSATGSGGLQFPSYGNTPVGGAPTGGESNGGGPQPPFLVAERGESREGNDSKHSPPWCPSLSVHFLLDKQEKVDKRNVRERTAGRCGHRPLRFHFSLLSFHLPGRRTAPREGEETGDPARNPLTGGRCSWYHSFNI